MAYAYLFQSELYCHRCGESLRAGLKPDNDSERFPQGPLADGGGEADRPQHCAECGAFLENPLTEEGFRFLSRELYLKNSNAEVLGIWRKFYKAKTAKDKTVLAPLSKGFLGLGSSLGSFAKGLLGAARSPMPTP